MYFVTICTHERECLFGTVRHGAVVLNAAGEAVRTQWVQLPLRFPSVAVDAFAVMPNHVHGVVVHYRGAASSAPTERMRILPGAVSVHPCGTRAPSCEMPVAAGHASATQQAGAHQAQSLRVGIETALQPAPTLGRVIRAFKSLSAIEVNRVLGRKSQPVWQRSYYEHIIRGGDDLDEIRRYIAENPLRWEEDPEHPNVALRV